MQVRVRVRVLCAWREVRVSESCALAVSAIMCEEVRVSCEVRVSESCALAVSATMCEEVRVCLRVLRESVCRVRLRVCVHRVCVCVCVCVCASE